MRLLSKTSATSELKKSNDELIDKNIRLRKYHSDIIQKLNTVKENYDPEKLKKLEEFEKFCKDLLEKKSKLLEELHAYESLITQKKETYYKMIEQQDALDEKIYQVKEANKKLDLRQVFVQDLEAKWKQKNGI